MPSLLLVYLLSILSTTIVMPGCSFARLAFTLLLMRGPSTFVSAIPAQFDAVAIAAAAAINTCQAPCISRLQFSVSGIAQQVAVLQGQIRSSLSYPTPPSTPVTLAALLIVLLPSR
jgi:hypothetical protein